ncbi:PhzF family phenazine biosynthesis protein [uncultured Corynebacterium sp.]|uniref:PhzF family phenazine biosynthesis protein n=1 Tax=uncultured Corynebacterium sp. TaxID=159447 RepID=UPI0025DBCAF4|nr:PhzF family phenazine biosynthesis protein [uncultured Corynebacterium sp.]
MKEEKDRRHRHLDLELAQIDAFTDRVFGGNPAAVVSLCEWPSDVTLQAIAAENNLSETAFLVGRIPADAPSAPSDAPAHHLRWFTPAVEIDLCGHATLASAAHLFSAADAGCQDFGACDGDDVLDDDANATPDRIQFWTRSGWLGVARTRGTDSPDLFTLDFPADAPSPIDADTEAISDDVRSEMASGAGQRSDLGGDLVTDPVVAAGRLTVRLAEALGLDSARIVDLRAGRTKVMVVVDSPDVVRGLSPDFAAVVRIAPHGIIVTADATGDAESTASGFDVVSRYFAPGIGIDEDPVTGSAHCVLGPYWFDKLGRDSLTAHQASARGGTLYLDAAGERIRISGHAVRYLTGTIRLPRD